MEKKSTYTSDVLVVGCGMAGLRAAGAASREGASVIIVSKGPTASPEVMGFNAIVEEGDDEEKYFADTCNSAYNINNKAISKVMAKNVRKQIDFLENIGFVFDKKPDGSYDTLHTLGCQYPRLVHNKALTGVEASKLMLKDCRQLGVVIVRPVMITELLKADDRIIGAVGINIKTGRIVSFSSKAVILATGGCGDMHSVSTYPKGIVGDGYAIAYRAGAELIDMEFQQFEPCSFVYPEEIRGKVIPTTLLRIGAELRNGNNEEFMHKYGLSRSNAQKGELSRAIVTEIREGRGTPNGGIYYDVTMMPRDLVVVGHSIFYEPALRAGLDLTKEPAEMIPAAHTNLGGVCINTACGTKIKGLYAAGEVTGGIHGANRIGGSAGAETLVYGAIAGEMAAKYSKEKTEFYTDIEVTKCVKHEVERLMGIKKQKGNGLGLAVIRKELGAIMDKKVGIIRNGDSLESAMHDIEYLHTELERSTVSNTKDLINYCQCENMLLLAKMQVKASLLRTESRGVFFREDYPERNDEEWLKNIIFCLDGEKEDVRIIPSR